MDKYLRQEWKTAKSAGRSEDLRRVFHFNEIAEIIFLVRHLYLAKVAGN